jgi:hypothetical protein
MAVGQRGGEVLAYVAFLTGAAYTGPYEVPALSLVVDNAAA